MNTTSNLGLKKPEQTEFYNVDDFNDNADVIDSKFSPSTGHKHTGAAGDAPQIGTDGIADGAVTAAKVGPDVATQAELDAVSAVATNALPKAGGTMTGALIADRDVNTNDTRLYQNLASYKDNGSPITGTIKIALPKTWSNTMMRIRIVGYDYSAFAAWEFNVLRLYYQELGTLGLYMVMQAITRIV